MKRIILFFSILMSISALAQRVEVNKIIVSVAAESWTARDQQVYEAVLNEVFKKKKISDFSGGAISDFVLSRVSFQEAKAFKLKSENVIVPDGAKKKLAAFNQLEIDREISVISGALGVLELKEAQHKDQVRFNNWLDLMKRKYAVKLKSSEIK